MAFTRPQLMTPARQNKDICGRFTLKAFEYEFQTSSLTLKHMLCCHNYHKASTQSCRLSECEDQQSEKLIQSYFKLIELMVNSVYL